MKKCSRCNLSKPINEFSKSKVSSDGLSAWCKNCHLSYVLEYREKNKRRERIELVNATKECPKCGQLKSIKDFYKTKVTKDGFQTLCKACIKNYHTELAKKHKERMNTKEIIEKECSQCGQVKSIKNFHKHIQQQDGYSPYCNECSKKYRKPYSDDTREYLRKYQNTRRAIDPMFKLNNNFGRMIRASIVSGKNSRHWEKVVGYTLLELVEHLENQFLPSMSWNNYGKWHIDHIVPVAYFKFSTTEDPDFKKCWALKNLRPMWAIDNIRKGGRIEDPNHLKLILDNDK